MKPHPRIRKTIKWGGAVVTVLLVVVWIGSGWICGALGWFGVFQGRVQVVIPSQQGPAFRLFGLYYVGRYGLRWGFQWDSLPQGHVAFVPIWILAAFAAATTYRVWVRDVRATRLERAARLNLCPKCNYDRTGLVGVGGADAVCPECGAERSGA